MSQGQRAVLDVILHLPMHHVRREDHPVVALRITDVAARDSLHLHIPE